jgi:hypothetical protein
MLALDGLIGNTEVTGSGPTKHRAVLGARGRS